MTSLDTIVAVATPAGRGGVGIIRVSGKLSASIATSILGLLPPPRKATYTEFKSEQDDILDSGIAIYFPSPHSFTGENVIEFQGHGGPVILDMVLKRCLSLGARLARPGEFSERAFLNDKLDLAQAEAISDLIDSSSEQAARSALRSLQGHFSSAIDELLNHLIELRVYVEAALDFPDEEIDFLAGDAVTTRLDTIKQQLQEIFSKAKQGSLLREGMQLVIVGQPNAGKSSLLNALSGNDSAIVTDVAGTTRDVLRETINLDGMPLHIIDTAGLRESNDPVEKIGIERAWQEIKKADLILLLIDDNDKNTSANEKILQQLSTNLPILRVHNKIDLSQQKLGKREGKIYISAKQQIGIKLLKNELKQYMGYQSEVEDSFIARRRHIQALEETQQAVDNAEYQLKECNAGELMAEELRLAQDSLGQITGRYTPDDLLGEIFSNFCIGK